MLLVLLTISYASKRVGRRRTTGQLLRGTHALVERNRCRGTHSDIGTVHAHCPGTFATEARKVLIVSDVKLLRTRSSLVVMSDVCGTRLRVFSSVRAHNVHGSGRGCVQRRAGMFQLGRCLSRVSTEIGFCLHGVSISTGERWAAGVRVVGDVPAFQRARMEVLLPCVVIFIYFVFVKGLGLPGFVNLPIVFPAYYHRLFRRVLAPRVRVVARHIGEKMAITWLRVSGARRRDQILEGFYCRVLRSGPFFLPFSLSCVSFIRSGSGLSVGLFALWGPTAWDLFAF